MSRNLLVSTPYDGDVIVIPNDTGLIELRWDHPVKGARSSYARKWLRAEGFYDYAMGRIDDPSQEIIQLMGEE
jgi:hypothetical protein